MNSDELIDFIESRRSVRSYKPDMIPDDIIGKIIEAGTIDPFYGAPVVLIVLADRYIPTHVYDGSLVIGNLMLAAHAFGVGSCWIHRAKEEFERPEGKEILQALGIEGDYEGIGHCILGYVEGEYPDAKPRKENWAYTI